MELLDKYNSYLSSDDRLKVVLTFSYKMKKEILSDIFIKKDNKYSFNIGNLYGIMMSFQFPDEVMDFWMSNILDSRIDIHYEVLKYFKEIRNDIDDIVYIRYSDNWYIALGRNGKLYYNCTESGKKEFANELQYFKDNYHITQDGKVIKSG